MSKLQELQKKLEAAKTNKFLPEALRAKAIAKIEREIAELEKSDTPKKGGSKSDNVKYKKFHFKVEGRDIKKDDPIYYQVGRDGDLIVGVIDEKLDHYLGNKPVSEDLSKAERTELYAENFSIDQVHYIDETPEKGKRGRKPGTKMPAKDKKASKTYKGKDVDQLDDKDCDELLAEIEERRAAAKKSAKKSAKKPVIEKVSEPIVRGVTKAIKSLEIDDLSDAKIKRIKDAITATKSFIQSLKTLLGEEYDAETVTEEIKPLVDLAKKIEEKYLKTQK